MSFFKMPINNISGPPTGKEAQNINHGESSSITSLILIRRLLMRIRLRRWHVQIAHYGPGA